MKGGITLLFSTERYQNRVQFTGIIHEVEANIHSGTWKKLLEEQEN